MESLDLIISKLYHYFMMSSLSNLMLLSRRNLLQSSLLLGFGTMMPKLGKTTSSDAVFAIPDDQIMVINEWDTLREVIVGRAEDAILPILPLNPDEEDTPQVEIEPELSLRLNQQLDGLVKLLEQHGVKVHRPRRLTGLEKEYLSYLEGGGGLIFMRDPVLVIGNLMIESSLRAVYRRKEIFSLRPMLQEFFQKGRAEYVAMPAPGPEEEGMFLEGGDVLLAGHDVFVGVSGVASDELGAQWLRRTLGDNFRVHVIPLREDVLHLDLALALLRPGLGIVHRNSLMQGLPAFLEGWDFIEINDEESESLAANVLVLDPQTVIVEQSQDRLIKELKKRGITVLPLEFDAPVLMSGGFRCATHPLRRFPRVVASTLQ
jgi:glycine amidinotransferase